jgi:capsular exopolysaccharide synthesis family protein
MHMPQYELNLRDYLRIFRKRKFVIIATFIAVTFLSVFLHPKSEPIYKATATVKIEERKTMAGLLADQVVVNPADLMESEVKIIKGYQIMKKAALKLNKIDENSSLEDVNTAVSQLQDSIETERVGFTNIINIIVTSNKPKEAMDFANTVAQTYTEENLLEKAKEARHARQFIEEQLVGLEVRLKQSEDALRQLGESAKNINLSGPIETRLVNLQFQLSELLQKYTEKYPAVMQLKEQIKDLEGQLKGFSGQELDYARLTRENEANKKLYTLLKERLEEARISEAQKVSDISLVDPAIMPDSPVSGGTDIVVFIGGLLGLALGIAFAFVVETLDTSIGTIEDVESVIKLPVLGVIPSMVSELYPNRGLFDRVKRRIFPLKKSEAEEKLVRLISHYKPQSAVAEAYRNIYTNLKISPSNKAILVTSSNPGEGKSTIVTNLGIVMGQTGLKVVLVSTDLRRPVLSKTFGVAKEPGLYEFVTGAANLDEVLKSIADIMVGEIKFEEILKTPGIENISIISSGHLIPNPVEILESKNMTKLVEDLKNRFDVIIFDAPPVLSVTDASLIAPRMDSVVIAYEIGRTSREALLRSKIQLESLGAKVAGVILNHTKAQTEGITPYHYYHYKYTYKTEEGREKKRRTDKKGEQE